MYDLTSYDISDLFKIRDVCVILMGFNFTLVKDLLQEINKEIQEREREYEPNSPEHERDIKE